MSALDATQGEKDARLTLAVLGKIVAAQKRGTLSSRMYIRRLPSQIVLEHTTQTDRDWVTKHFPGEIDNRYGHIVRKVSSTARVEEVHYVAHLREALDGDKMMQRMVPRLEVWGIQVPHQCTRFSGSATYDKVIWKCAAYNCGKRITKTTARALGLLP